MAGRGLVLVSFLVLGICSGQDVLSKADVVGVTPSTGAGALQPAGLVAPASVLEPATPPVRTMNMITPGDLQPSPAPLPLEPSPAPGQVEAPGSQDPPKKDFVKVTAKLAMDAPKGATEIGLDDVEGFNANSTIRIGAADSPTQETVRISEVNVGSAVSTSRQLLATSGTLSLASPLKFAHGSAEAVEQLPDTPDQLQPKQGAAPTEIAKIGNFTVESYESQDIAWWTYDGATGPGKWADLAPEYGVCRSGTHQSPVDMIDIRLARFLPLLITSYKDTEVTAINDGHTIKIPYDAGSYFNFGQSMYELKELQFHSPSEHKLDGFGLPMEVQFFHKSEDGTIAVISVFLKIGEPNSFLDKFWDFTPTVGLTQVKTDIVVNAADILPSGVNYYAYYGSLARPPCTEGVKWFIMKDTLTISKKQLDRFRAIMHGDNNRPPNTLGDRTVESSILNTIS